MVGGLDCQFLRGVRGVLIELGPGDLPFGEEGVRGVLIVVLSELAASPVSIRRRQGIIR